ncbi:TetR/AcrR family transcriptional regulator [Candidatus Sulfidibacterium hydrothermale]|uniref:TetR/AcrR family transcriptional regulator n=1 Tax=Candidatus Sulfidibacterium hydrothermale TaxID=2875962 RepID=UPI001F0A2B93|nr:TetR/AcrR family transcriptional regulator [Candidatus Sulfidibacterium hydrothermale]UBM62214.1 TetR/AcrR family transcriptional regulator [Candidatus Sulfidibacterium hydrothermale]
MSKQNEQEIIQQVAELYKKYGIKSITMDDVSRELGISKKTLYTHFTDKSALVNAVVDYLINVKVAYFKSQKKGQKNAVDELFYIFKYYLSILKEFNPSLEFDLKKYYPQIWAWVKKRKREGIIESTLDNLKRGKKEGYFRKDLNEDLISRLYLLRVESLPESDLFSQEEIFSQDLFKEMFFYHLYGVLSEKGLAYLKEHMNQLKILK